MKTIDWYFDFISPFAYLQSTQLHRLESRAVVRRRSLLLAGLLGHWNNVGPAEVAPKRVWTFRHCVWLADKLGVPLKMPTMHPFNPLPLLRLSTLHEDTPAIVDRLFAFVWREGHVPTDRDAWAALLDEFGVDEAALKAAAVKDALRATGDDAIAAGVFGVPTSVIEGHPFWGLDATEMLLDYLDGAPLFDGDDMRRAIEMPVGPGRFPPQAPHATG